MQTKTGTRTTIAYQDFEAQRQDSGDEYSLNSMWRACGSPREKHPAVWVHLANDLIEATVRYRRELDVYNFSDLTADTPIDYRGDVIFTMADPFCGIRAAEPGDIMTNSMLAIAYADFLDTQESWSDFEKTTNAAYRELIGSAGR